LSPAAGRVTTFLPFVKGGALNGDSFCADFRAMPFWGVVRSLPRREAFAAERCADGGFEVFLPLVQTKRASQPLFSGYFFCRIVDRWRSINTTLGVLCLVRTGDCPAKCPDHEIASLKAMTDAHGYVRLPEAPAAPAGRKIAIGAKVRITAGPFGGMSGLYAGQSTRERELVLLNLLGGQRPVSIPAGLVVPAS
jgi:transcriptional antiterminator RfaH